MKIVLLVLSGDPDQAREWLQKSYPGANIERISRGELEGRTPLRRLSVLRSFRPNILAVATERLAWQSGQNALLLFGSLARARRVVLFDTSGNSREETSAAILGRAPFRFAGEAVASALVIARSHSGLKKLERAVKSRANSFLPSRPGKILRRCGSLTCAARRAWARRPVARRRTSMALSTRPLSWAQRSG